MPRLNDTERHMLDLANKLDTIEPIASAMLAALQAVKTAADRETIVAGRHKRSEGQALIATVVAAIAQAKAAGIKAG